MRLILIVVISFTSLQIMFAQNVGVGTDNPVEFFSVGANSQYRVNANGNLVRINDIQYNFPSVQATSGSVLANDGSGNLSWTKVTTGNISATGTANNTTFLRGDGAWAAPAGGGTTLAVDYSLNFANTALTQNITSQAGVINNVNAGTYLYSLKLMFTGSNSVVSYQITDGSNELSSNRAVGANSAASFNLNFTGIIVVTGTSNITLNLMSGAATPLQPQTGSFLRLIRLF